MTGHGAKFGRKKEEAIAALLTQRNVEGAARAAGIATQTLVRWMRVPEFQTAYRQARREAFGQSIARLQQASSAALSTLLKVMIDQGSPPSTRFAPPTAYSAMAQRRCRSKILQHVLRR
ncbi:MAG TPA: hypothetical protein VHZ07_21495 [Bryobacteraceae bacterium]|jgi:hypothetical protein|nr:hypothetical protein [Bryobacteraceae bacterium]